MGVKRKSSHKDISDTEKVSTPHGFLVSLRKDGIIEIELKKGTEVSVQHVKEIVSAVEKAGKKKSYPILIKPNEFTFPNAEARKYMACEECNPYSLAEAYLIKSISQKMIGNFYLRFNKPFRPTKLFTSEEDAVKWLNGFKS